MREKARLPLPCATTPSHRLKRTAVVTATARMSMPIPFGPRDAGVPMTLDEFERAEFERGWRYEIIRGVLVVSPSPLEEERDANEELGHWLRNYGEHHVQGYALNLTLPEHNVR